MKRNAGSLLTLIFALVLTSCGKTNPLTSAVQGSSDTVSQQRQQVESLQRVVADLNDSLAALQNNPKIDSKPAQKSSETLPVETEFDMPLNPEEPETLSAAASFVPTEESETDATTDSELDLDQDLDLAEPLAVLDETTSSQERTPTTSRSKRKEKRLHIDVYDGYGSTSLLLVSGRLFADRALDAVEEKDSRFKNLVKTSRRFVLNEAEKVWVRVELGQRVREVQTSEDGAFEAVFENLQDLPLGLHAARVSLSSRNLKAYQAGLGTGNFILHSPDSHRLGIISDIDDTILRTNATSKVQMLKTIFLSNYKTQEPVIGMSDLFKAIHHGPEGDGYEATHYVSSSPDNLYSRINLFLDYRNFPQGSIDLKNIGLGKGTDSLFDHEHYKIGKIRKILQTYPSRRYILFGDSGEHDPEIYRQVVKEFPNQIVAVYIHNVTEDDPFATRFQGQMLFSDPDKVKKDLLNRGLIHAY